MPSPSEQVSSYVLASFSFLDQQSPFSILNHKRHNENCRLFLKAAGIRQHKSCGGFQIEEFQIAERLHSPDPVSHGKAEVTDVLMRARVYREEHRHGLRYFFE